MRKLFGFDLPKPPPLPAEARAHLRQAQQVLSRADGMLKTVFYAREGSVVDKALAGASLLSEVIDIVWPPVGVGDALRQAGYEEYDSGVAPLIRRVLTESVSEDVVDHPDGTEDPPKIAYYAVGGVARAVAVVRYTDDEAVGPWLLKGSRQALADMLYAHAWRHQELEVLVRQDQSRGDRSGGLALSPLRSARPYIGEPPTEWYAERMAKYRGFGNRTIQLVGPSGVGKTTLARALGRALVGETARVLRITAEAHGKLSGSDLIELVELLKPDVFIVDDWGSVYGVGGGPNASPLSILAFLERLHERVPLSVLTTMVGAREGKASANGMTRYGGQHGLRPGRLDESFALEEPAAAQREVLLAEFLREREIDWATLPAGVRTTLVDRTDGFTGAYLQELSLRIKVHGVDAWRTELARMCVEVEETDKRVTEIRRRRRKSNASWLAARAVSRTKVGPVVNPKATRTMLAAWLKSKKLPAKGTREAMATAVAEELARREHARREAAKGGGEDGSEAS